MAQPGRKKREAEPPLPTAGEIPVVDETAAKESEAAPAGKGVMLVLVGAGSYTSPGSGLGTIRKGQPFEADEATAKELLRTGFFREA